MNIYKTLGRALALLTLSTAPLFAACDSGETIIRFSHVVGSEKHPKGVAAEKLAARVNAEMDGLACMIVFPNATLMDDRQVLRALLTGEVQLAAPSTSKLGEFSNEFQIFDLPFMFKDLTAVEKFQASPRGQEILNSMERRGITGLSYWHNGMKQLSASRPLKRPEDAAGLKFRIIKNPILDAQIEAIDALPYQIPWSLTQKALIDGVVDGQENTWSNIFQKKFYSLQDGVTESNHGLLGYALLASSDWLETRPAPFKKQFLEIVAEITAEQNQTAAKLNAAARSEIIAQGGVVRSLTAEERAAWVKAMDPVWTRFTPAVGSETIAEIQEINRALN